MGAVDLSYYHKKSILITGGTGYIGFSLVQRLSSVDCTIHILARKQLINLPKNKATIHFHQGDITDPSIWSKTLSGIDTVFHCAGQTSAYYANEHPLEDLQTNVVPILHFLEATEKLNHRPDIIFAGTSTEVGIPDTTRIDETLQDAPITVYDINKLAAEKYLQYYTTQRGGRSATLRLCNIYGPGPTSSKSDRGITNLMIKKALKNEPLTVYGDGQYIRDYVYIDDLINAFLAAGSHMHTIHGGYYIIGTGTGHSIKEMITMIAEKGEAKTKNKIVVQYIPFPKTISPIEFRNVTADPNLFTSKTGWKPTISLEEGIERTIEYFIKS